MCLLLSVRLVLKNGLNLDLKLSNIFFHDLAAAISDSDFDEITILLEIEVQIILISFDSLLK